MSQHWTASDDEFTSALVVDFMSELEDAMASKGISQRDLAERLGKTEGRVSQMLNTPGNITIKSAITLARTLGLKVALVAYDDNDPNNANGPVVPWAFSKCWEALGKPTTGWDLEDAISVARLAIEKRSVCSKTEWIVDTKSTQEWKSTTGDAVGQDCCEVANQAA